MAFVVLYDANVLYPAPLRDTLVRLARVKLFQAKWTERILDECFAAILRQRPDLTETALERTRRLMCEYVDDWEVTGFETLIETLQLPDPDDRHVLAAAIRASAQVIVTENLRDFPRDVLEPFGVEAQTADEFLLHVTDLGRARVLETLVIQASELRNPPRSVDELLTLLATFIPRTVARLRE